MNESTRTLARDAAAEALARGMNRQSRATLAVALIDAAADDAEKTRIAEIVLAGLSPATRRLVLDEQIAALTATPTTYREQAVRLVRSITAAPPEIRDELARATITALTEVAPLDIGPPTEPPRAA